MARRVTPTIRRRLLGQELRLLRVNAGITPGIIAKALGVTASSLSRIETGRQAIKEPYVRVIASMGGASKTKLDELLVMCEGAAQREWFHDLASSSPEWFKRYLGLESAASEIRTYTVELVHGLMQTEEYARALAEENTPDATARNLDGYVALRRGRQDLLLTGDEPHLHVVMNQVALATNTGGPNVMRAQVEHLLKLADFDHVTLQVLPFGSGAHPGMTSGFTLMGFDGIPGMATAYIDVGRGAVYPDAPADLDQYRWKFDQLTKRARTPAETRDLLVKVASDL